MEDTMIKGTTKSGFRYEVSDKLSDDWKVFKLIALVEEDGTAIPKLVDAILGQKQSENLEKFLEKRDGYVSTAKITEEVMEIFKNPALKNS
jgi:hypothetical protein